MIHRRTTLCSLLLFGPLVSAQDPVGSQAGPGAPPLDAPHHSFPYTIDSDYLRRRGGYSTWAAEERPWAAVKGWVENREIDGDESVLEFGSNNVVDFVEEVARDLKIGPGRQARLLEQLRIADVAIQVRLEDESGAIFQARGVLTPGSTKVFSNVETSTVPVATDLEGSLDAHLFELGTVYIASGVSVAIYALPVPGIGWAADLALVLTENAGRPPVDAEHPVFKTLVTARQRVVELGGSVLLEPGVESSLEFPSAATDQQLRLTLSVQGEAPAESVSTDPELTCVIAPTVLLDVGRWDSFEPDYSNSGVVAFQGPTAAGRARAVVERARLLSATTVCTIHGRGGAANDTPARFSLVAIEGSSVRFARGEISGIPSWNSEFAQMEPTVWFHFGGFRGSLELARPMSVHAEFRNLDVSRAPRVQPLFREGVHQPDSYLHVLPQLKTVTLSGRARRDDAGQATIESSSGVPGKEMYSVTVNASAR